MTIRSIALLGLLGLAACAPQGGTLYVPPGYDSGLTNVGPANGISVSNAAPVSSQITVPISTLARQAPDAATADAFAISFLNSLQPRSFANRREYCGYFFVTAQGTIAATPPIPGTLASCTQPGPGPAVFASYHTHGAYDRGYDNEVPSAQDLTGDLSFGIDGYVSTPGGRVWRNEVDEAAALLICGPGCVAVDPGYIPDGEAGITARMSLAQLRAR